MRFEQYLLNESTEKIVELLQKDCKPFLSQMGKYPLWRGITKVPKTFAVRKPRKDRKPMNTSQALQVVFDSIFQEKFGWKPRSSGLFVTGNYNEAKHYGWKVCSVWPIGNFKFIWSPDIQDLFQISPMRGFGMEFNLKSGRYGNMDVRAPGDKEWLEKTDKVNKARQVLREMIHSVYKDKNLRIAIESNNEIMIQCKKYYAVRLDLTELLAEVMGFTVLI